MPEYFVFRIQEVNIAGGNHRFAQLLSQPHNGPVKVSQILIVFHRALGDHKPVVTNGLNLQKVIKARNPQQFVPTAVVHHSPEQLAGFTGGAHKDTLPPFDQLTLGDTGHTLIVFQMGIGDQPVEIPEARIILCVENNMPCLQRRNFIAGLHAGHGLVDLRHTCNALLLQHLEEPFQHIANRHGIIHCPMVVKVRQAQCICHNIQLIFVEPRQ